MCVRTVGVYEWGGDEYMQIPAKARGAMTGLSFERWVGLALLSAQGC